MSMSTNPKKLKIQYNGQRLARMQRLLFRRVEGGPGSSISWCCCRAKRAKFGHLRRLFLDLATTLPQPPGLVREGY